MQLRFFLIVNKYQIVSAYCIHVKMAETLQISTFSPRSEGIHRVRNGHHIALFLLQGHGLALAFWESVFSCCKASAGPGWCQPTFCADSVLENVKSNFAWEDFGRWVEAQEWRKKDRQVVMYAHICWVFLLGHTHTTSHAMDFALQANSKDMS